jgi:hypothetical protein
MTTSPRRPEVSIRPGGPRNQKDRTAGSGGCHRARETRWRERRYRPIRVRPRYHCNGSASGRHVVKCITLQLMSEALNLLPRRPGCRG